MRRAPVAKRARTVYQLEAAECGAAALAMVLAAHGRHVPLEELRLACGVSRDGAKASSILKAARAQGLEARGLKAEPQHLGELELPLIAFVDFCHFVVVDGIGRGKVHLNDPAQGRRTVTAEQFDEMFTGVVLVFRPGPDLVPGDARPSTWRSLIGRTRGVRWAVTFVFLVSVLLVLPGLVTPVFSRIFVDQVLLQGLDDWVPALVAGMVLTAILRFGLIELQAWYLTRTETHLAIRGARELLAHLLRLPIAFYGARFAGEIGTRLQLSDRVAALLTGELARAALNVVTAIFFLGMIWLYSPPLALLVAVLGLLNLAVVMAVAGRMADIYQKVAIDQGKLAGASLAGLRDIETFKASGAEDSFFARWSGLSANALSAEQRFQAISALAGGLSPLLSAVGAAGILTLGAHLVIDGQLTLGTLVAVQSLAASFTGPVASLASLGSQVQQLKSSHARIDDILRQKPVSADVDEAPSEPLPRGALKVEGLTYGHLPLEPPLIEGLSLELAAGGRLALVGASGSGKSTLGRLLVGLLEPASGQVLLDDRPLESWPRAVRAATIAYVDQEVVLFEGSIQENLALWDGTLPEADLVAAAQDACIHELIASRPGAYASPVEEGGRNFSGGQRQRLELARALATRPRLLVLDEATSALDPVTEKQILENLRRRCLLYTSRCV